MRALVNVCRGLRNVKRFTRHSEKVESRSQDYAEKHPQPQIRKVGTEFFILDVSSWG